MNERNNMVLKKIRYALRLKENGLKEIFALADYPIDESVITGFLASETSPEYRELSDAVLEKFLDGLITYKRGKKEDTSYAPKKSSGKLLMPKKKD